MYSETMCSDLGLFWQYTMYMWSLRSCGQNKISETEVRIIIINHHTK